MTHISIKLDIFGSVADDSGFGRFWKGMIPSYGSRVLPHFLLNFSSVFWKCCAHADFCTLKYTASKFDFNAYLNR